MAFDQPIAVLDTLGTIYRRDDGTSYFLNAFGIGDGVECVAPGQTAPPRSVLGYTVGSCADYVGPAARVLPTLDPTIPLAQFAAQGAELQRLLDPISEAQLTNLPFTELSPLLQAVVLSPLGVIPILQAIPELSGAIAAETAEGFARRLATYDVAAGQETFLSPYDTRTRLVLETLNRTAELAPFVRAEQERSMGILEDLGITGFNGGFNGQALYGNTLPALYSPLSQTFPSDPLGSGSVGGSGGGFLDTFGTPLLQAIQALAQSGVIRGSVGAFLAPQMAAPMMMAAAPAAGGTAVPSFYDLLLGIAAQAGGQMTLGDMSASGMVSYTDAPSQNVPWPVGTGVAGACVPSGGSRNTRVNVMTAPGLFKIGCGPCGTPVLRAANRVYADNPDGSIDIYWKLGKATHPSPRAAARVVKRLSKHAGLALGRSSSTRRARRRPR